MHADLTKAQAYTAAAAMTGIFLLNFFNDYHLGETHDTLWMCHVANVLLCGGLLLRQRRLMQLAVLWIIVGTPLWLMDSMQNRLFSFTSTVSHLGGLLIGLWALRQIRTGRPVWHLALGVFVLLQQLSRVLTPVSANVNISQAVWPGWETVFPHYGNYWLFTTASATLSLWLVERILFRIFPLSMPSTPPSSMHATHREGEAQ